MLNEGLSENDFKRLLSDSEQEGFLDKKVKVVDLPVGQKLWKLSSYPVGKGRSGYLSPWWSSVTEFKEDKLGARGRYLEAQANSVTLREMTRFASAIRIDWNDIEEYQEITLKVSARAFWGQYQPQPAATRVANKSITDMSEQEFTQMVKNGAKRKRLSEMGVYVPDTLGGIEAWQMYIPNLGEADVTKTKTIPSHDMAALAVYFGLA